MGSTNMAKNIRIIRIIRIIKIIKINNICIIGIGIKDRWVWKKKAGSQTGYAKYFGVGTFMCPCMFMKFIFM